MNKLKNVNHIKVGAQKPFSCFLAYKKKKVAHTAYLKVVDAWCVIYYFRLSDIVAIRKYNLYKPSKK